MTARLLVPLAVAAAVAAGLPSPAAGAAAPADTLVKHRLRSTAPVEGLPGRRAETTATLVVPAPWRVTGRPSPDRLRVAAGHDVCTYAITFATRMFVGPARPAAEVAAERVPGTGRYVLDSGVRGPAAWRVVRLPGEVRLRATRVDGSSASGPRRLPSGQRLWREITATAAPRPGDECHSGTYTEFAGPGIGDVLATARGRGYA